MTNTWFTSDTHFGHKNIISYCDRPFNKLYHMDTTIIKRFNERIKPDDTVFFLGDFCFRNSPGGKDGEGTTNNAKHYLDQLNGSWIFIRGNHDNNNSLKTIIESLIIHSCGRDIYLCHNPENVNEDFEINLVGHIHEKWKFKKLSKKSYMINVGVDVNNFYPKKLSELLNEFEKWKKGEK